MTSKPLRAQTDLPALFVSANEVEAFDFTRAVDAIEAALRAGLDPATDPPRSGTPVGDHSNLLLMPSIAPEAVGVKVVTTNPDNPATGLPFVHGIYVLFDRPALAPIAILDGAALTTLRTPAVSVAAVRPALQRFDHPLNVVIFGVGPQGIGHLDALKSLASRDGDFPVPGKVTLVARHDLTGRLPSRPGIEISGMPKTSPELEQVLVDADVVVCATNARRPLFDSSLLNERSVTIAVGSHSPDVTEVEPTLCSRATVVVEDVATALRECGEIVEAISAGVLAPEQLVSVAEVLGDARRVAHGRAVLFKGAGMAWEDLVVARAIVNNTKT